MKLFYIPLLALTMFLGACAGLDKAANYEAETCAPPTKTYTEIRNKMVNAYGGEVYADLSGAKLKKFLDWVEVKSKVNLPYEDFDRSIVFTKDRAMSAYIAFGQKGCITHYLNGPAELIKAYISKEL